ncbi:unnamed protein product, partial [Polarella glacialis]
HIIFLVCFFGMFLAVLSGRYFVSGSTNWTTSSRGNIERGTLTELNEYATRQQRLKAEADLKAVEEFTSELRAAEENALAERQEERRGKSEPLQRSPPMMNKRG